VLEFDETLPECAAREVREETGVAAEATRLIGIYTSPDFDVDYPNGDQVQQVTACFECRATGASSCEFDSETLDVAWFDLDDPPSTSLWYRAMIEDLRRGARSATFDRGGPGHARQGEPFFQQMRRYVGKARLVMPAATAFVRNEDGHVLLQRRADDGQWGLPGGAMELGERIDQTAVNEVLEETGLDVEPVRLIGVYSDRDFLLAYPNGDELKVVSILFECRATGGNLRADGVESAEVRFFPLDAFPPMAQRYRRRIEDGLADREEAVF